MRIDGTTVLVTGANRGLGQAFAAELLARGAACVYAAARDPDTVTVAGVEPLALDITDPASVARAATLADDVDIVINNAARNTWTDLLDGDDADFRSELDTNVLGTLNVFCRFAPVLRTRPTAAFLTVLSAVSFFPWRGLNSYAVSKTAEWALVNAVRVELAGTGVLVSGMYLATAATDMGHGATDAPSPLIVVRRGLDGLEADNEDIFADQASRTARAQLTAPA